MNDELFIEIYEKNKTSVFRIAFSYVKDRELAEDVLQNVFLKLYTAPPRNESNPAGWLAVVTKNQCLDFLRSRKREREVLSDLKSDPLFHEEESTDVLALVDKLPEKYATLIRLFYYGGLRVKEIASALHISENNVKKRLNRAREKLKNLIEEDAR